MIKKTARYLFLCVVCVSFFASVVCGADIDEDALYALNEEGIKSVNNGDYETALMCFQKAYAINTQDETIKGNLLAVFTQLAVKCLNENDHDNAIRYFEEALRLDSSNVMVKKNIAFAYFKKGMGLKDAGDIEQAVMYASKGLGFDPDNEIITQEIATLLYNKAVELYSQRDYTKAVAFLNQSLEYNDQQSYTYEVLGDIGYYSQQLDRAREYWDQALELEYSDRVKQKLAKLEEFAPAEEELEAYEAEHFVIRYDKSNELYSGYKIRQLLRTAYRKIGIDFNYYPDKSKLVVLLYPPDNVENILSSLHYASAAYDGKIHLPQEKTGVADQDLKALMWHEYTHALVHQLGGNQVPSWLHEGLAQYEENKIKPIDCEKLIEEVRGGAVYDLRADLNVNIQGMGYEDARMFYLRSFTLMECLVKRYRIYKIREVLEHIRDGDTVENALNKALFLTVERINKKWQEHLEKNYN